MSDRCEGARSVGETRSSSAFWPGGILETYVEDQNTEFKRCSQEMDPAVDWGMKYPGCAGKTTLLPAGSNQSHLLALIAESI